MHLRCCSECGDSGNLLRTAQPSGKVAGFLAVAVFVFWALRDSVLAPNGCFPAFLNFYFSHGASFVKTNKTKTAGRRVAASGFRFPRSLHRARENTNSPSPRSYVQDPGGEKGTLWPWLGDLAREEARALKWHQLEPRRASCPLPRGFPGAHVAGPPPPGGISPRSLSPGHPVPAGADSQHTPDKLDTPTLKIPGGSCARGAQWQAPHAGVVVPLLISASERDASGSFAAWHPCPRTARPCRHPLCPPGMRVARGRS